MKRFLDTVHNIHEEDERDQRNELYDIDWHTRLKSLCEDDSDFCLAFATTLIDRLSNESLARICTKSGLIPDTDEK